MEQSAAASDGRRGNYPLKLIPNTKIPQLHLSACILLMNAELNLKPGASLKPDRYVTEKKSSTQRIAIVVKRPIRY